jgi:hypothetical protein
VSENDRELPAFTWDGDYWSAQVKMPAWRAYLSKSDRGFVTVEITPPKSTGESPCPPSEEQRAAIAQLLADQEKICAVVLKALAKQHAGSEDSWDDDEKPWKPLKDISGLRKHVTLNRISVLEMAKQKRAYLGFSFSCSWDGEHGAGVMTHKTRVVTHGGADHSFLWWLAKRDGGVALKAATAPKAKAKPTAKAKLARKKK